jgi:hypothetical protein
MKKYFALLVCIVFFSLAKAQSFEIGARYLAESNWFFNGTVSAVTGGTNQTSENYTAAYSYSWGLHLAYNFNDHVGLETDVMIASLSQSYSGTFSQTPGILTNGVAYYPGGDYTSITTLSEIQVPLFFRFLSGNGAYAELGPQIEIITDGSYNATYLEGPRSSFGSDVTKYFASNYFSAVLAFGNNIRLSHSFFFNINLRFTYEFTDMKGVDALGQNLGDSRLYDSKSPYYMYPKYIGTNAISAAFGVGFIYRIGHDF